MFSVSMGEISSDFVKFDNIKNNVIMRAIPANTTEYNAIFDLYGDIAVCVYGMLKETESEIVTFKIPKEAYSEEEKAKLKDYAYKNTIKKHKPKIMSLDDDLCSCFIGMKSTSHDIFSDSYKLPEEINTGLVLTYKGMTTNGATAIFLPGVANRIKDLIGEDYYICPTSIHEVMIHPISCGIDEDGLTEILLETIREATQDIDFLSRTVYKYSQFNFPA